MWHEVRLRGNFLAALKAVDLAIAGAVMLAGCRHCGGVLRRADYPRKPRGVGVGDGGETWTRRISFCCSAEGCRRCSTPPSVRSLGRKVLRGADRSRCPPCSTTARCRCAPSTVGATGGGSTGC